MASSQSGAFGVNGGFNQSGGGYYMTLADIRDSCLTLTPGSGSGGATTVGTFADYAWNSLSPGTNSTLVASNKVIKDMGKTVVSAGRTFRKFQAVATTASFSTFGVAGQAASTTNPGYITFYLQTGLPSVGVNGSTPAPIARYAF